MSDHSVFDVTFHGCKPLLIVYYVCFDCLKQKNPNQIYFEMYVNKTCKKLNKLKKQILN